MATTVHKTPKSGRQSLFFNDLSTPVSSRRGKFSTPGQAAAVSALWRENFANSDLPPPPVFTLDDRSDFSPESAVPDYPLSPEVKSDPRTPVRSNSSGRGLSSPGMGGRSEASTSYGGKRQDVQGSLNLNWWSPGKSAGEVDEKGKGSPVEGVVQTGALITLPPPREVARPEMQKSSNLVAGNLDEEEWVTVYGFPPGDTNLVLREFEKCGVILKHVPGPRNANWMHILYQNRTDAQKALRKNGMQINGVLIVGVKPVDPLQQQVLGDNRISNQGFMTLPIPSPSRSSEAAPSKPTRPYYHLPNGTSSIAKQSAGAIASPEKSVVSKIMDLMFGL
ncbi:Nucleoporin nup35 [Dionaea muscipula]